MNTQIVSPTDWQALYHYTSLKGFERIVKNGYIAMNDIIKSNDPAEGFFAFDALRNAYSSLYRDEEIDRETYHKLHNIFFVFSENETAFDRFQQTVLSISFCEPELPLALWRSYGDNGKGICFCISKERLIEIGKQQGFSFRQIEYLTEKEMEVRARKFWKENKEKSEEDLTALLKDFFINGYFIKRAENSFEKEWRLAYIGLNLESYSILTQTVPDEIDAFMRDDDIVIYYKLRINAEQLIEYIYLGPQCKIRMNEMKLFLFKNKISHNGVLNDGTVMR